MFERYERVLFKKLETSRHEMNQRFDNLHDCMDKRFETIESSMDKRFEKVESSLDEIKAILANGRGPQ